MEKFRHREYRDDLAEDLKNIPDHEERKAVLESEEESIRYKEAKSEHIKDVADFIEAKSLGVDASIKYQKDELLYLREKAKRDNKKIEDKSEKIESAISDLSKEKKGLEKEKLLRSVAEGQKYLSELLDGGFLNKPENVEPYVDEVERLIDKKLVNARLYNDKKNIRLLEEKLIIISKIRAELAKGDQFIFDKELAKKLLLIRSSPNDLSKSEHHLTALVYNNPRDVRGSEYDDKGNEVFISKELGQIGEQRRISSDQKMIRELLCNLAALSKMFPDMPISEIERYSKAIIGLDDQGYLSKERKSKKQPFEIVCEDGRKWRLPNADEKIYFLGATKGSFPITRFAGRRKEYYGRYMAAGNYEFETTSSSCAGGAQEVEDGIKFGGGNDNDFLMKMFNNAESAGLLPVAIPGTPLFVEQRGDSKVIVLPISSRVPEVIDGYTLPTNDVIEINPSRDPNIRKIREEEGKKGVNEYISKLINEKLAEKMKGEGDTTRE